MRIRKVSLSGQMGHMVCGTWRLCWVSALPGPDALGRHSLHGCLCALRTASLGSSHAGLPSVVGIVLASGCWTPSPGAFSCNDKGRPGGRRPSPGYRLGQDCDHKDPPLLQHPQKIPPVLSPVCFSFCLRLVTRPVLKKAEGLAVSPSTLNGRACPGLLAFPLRQRPEGGVGAGQEGRTVSLLPTAWLSS